MGLRSKALIIAGVLIAGSLRAAALAVPQGLAADVNPGSLSLSWSPVEGAGLYRVAVFDAPEKDGKRPLLAAVWVKGHEYVYGQTATVAKAGKFPSTKPLPLPAAHKLRVMVAAAKANGDDKGEWAGLDVESAGAVKASAPIATATPTVTSTTTPSAVSGTATTKDAELEVQGSEEFKQTPDAAVLEIDESGDAEAGAAGLAAGAAGAATGVASAAAGAAMDTSSACAVPAGTATVQSSVSAASTLGEAKGLNVSGHFEQAETAFRSLLEKEPENADLWEGLGDSFAGRKMKLEAKESYEKALSLNKAKTHLKDWIDKNVRR
jgi:hypothetical protein